MQLAHLKWRPASGPMMIEGRQRYRLLQQQIARQEHHPPAFRLRCGSFHPSDRSENRDYNSRLKFRFIWNLESPSVCQSAIIGIVIVTGSEFHYGFKIHARISQVISKPCKCPFNTPYHFGLRIHLKRSFVRSWGKYGKTVTIEAARKKLGDLVDGASASSEQAHEQWSMESRPSCCHINAYFVASSRGEICGLAA